MTKETRSFVGIAALAASVSLAIAMIAFSLRGYVIREYLANNPQDVQRIVKDYLAAHPEVLRDVLAGLINPPGGDPGGPFADKSAEIQSNAKLLFASSRQVTLGNPAGDVTIVEFFDYNCPYCRRSAADMVTLIKDDPKLKVVLKEFPILSPASTEAARVAIAVRMQDASGQKYLDFHLKLMEGRGRADKDTALAAAQSAGLDMERLQTDLTSDEISQTLAESAKLAESLGIDATPCYVVGDLLVRGAIGVDLLQEKIKLARERTAK